MSLAATPIYKTPVPTSFCESAASLYKSLDSCEENGGFVKQAKQCWSKLEDLQKKVTKELESRVGKPSADGQTEAFGKSAATYEEGIAAHEYMVAVTQLAQGELDKYFDIMVYPDEAESEKEVIAEGCYIDNATALDNVAEQFQEKLVATVSKIESAETMKNESSGNRTQTGAIDTSVSSSAKATKGKSAAVKGKKVPTVKNTVTGIEEDKQKQAPKK